MAELRASIVGEFKGKKAFKDADKATSALDKGVKRLGASLVAAFSVQKLSTFSKNAVKAFAENEKSAKRLETVVKNLGLAFEIPGIEASLDKVSAKFGYEGEVLREAFQKLITTTGSAKKSQDLLNLSLDIAAGSGVDLLTVNQDLAAAYVGQTRGLRKYNLGLTQSELKTLDFDSAVSKLSANFKGAGVNELTTYSGQMRVLQEAADNAQEIIGGGLVDALALLAGEGNTVEPLAESMSEFSIYVSDAIVGVALLIDKLKKVPGLGDQNALSRGSFIFSPTTSALAILKKGLDYVSKTGKEFRTPGMGGYPSSALGPGYIDPNDAARKKAEAAAAKRAKELAALTKKGLDTQKKSLAEAKKKAALDKASKTLNLEAIGIEAALKGKISETDRLSLELQKAILEGNATLATQLSDQLEAAIKRNNALQAALLATPKAPNPYEDWKVPDMTPIVGPVVPKLSESIGLPFPGYLGITPITPKNPLGIPYGEQVPNFNVPDFNVPSSGMVGRAANDYLGIGALGGANAASTINVIVNLDGQEVGNAVRDSSINSSLSGSFNTVNRFARFEKSMGP
jgi:hypothetical protein